MLRNAVASLRNEAEEEMRGATSAAPLDQGGLRLASQGKEEEAHRAAAQPRRWTRGGGVGNFSTGELRAVKGRCAEIQDSRVGQ